MRTAIAIAAAIGLAAGCKKEEKRVEPPKAAPVTAGTVGADGARRIPVGTTMQGYNPDQIAAKPNEKLVLVFTRTIDDECFEKVRTPDGKEIALPLNQPVDVPITAPASGSVTFACGMDMFRGTIVTSPSG